ncbi:MAG: hypothetical protein ACP5GZ_08305 [Vulcanisaeta sp.]|jgi:hypothetical protein|uniref:hypothetical protein n=1 Tax=Vulcanisaeta sp. TaxID=2020871 RepID=UPI003D0DBC36
MLVSVTAVVRPLTALLWNRLNKLKDRIDKVENRIEEVKESDLNAFSLNSRTLP